MWLNKVTKDLMQIPNFLDYYEKELMVARTELDIRGNIEQVSSRLPGIIEYRFNQLQEIEGVLEYLNIQLRKTKHKHYIKFLEGYARALTSRDAERYADAETEVIDLEIINNEVALLRNKWQGIIKAIENKSYMIGHVVKLRTAGMEDVVIS